MADERGKDTSIVYDPFPISGSVAANVLDELISNENNLGSMTRAKNAFRSENADLFAFINEAQGLFERFLPGVFDPNYEDGATIGYQLLSAQAALKGGRLATITPDEIDTNINDDMDMGTEARGKELEVNEPGLNQILKGYLDDSNPVDLAKIMGIMHVFLVFRTKKEIQNVADLFNRPSK